MKGLRAGGTISFGKYPQGTNGEVLPVEWQVLGVERDYAILLSRYILDVRPFSNEARAMYWTSSSLREWLNVEFPARAFSHEELERIYVPENPDNSAALFWFLTGDDADTDGLGERVFLLSASDMAGYFPGENPIDCPGSSTDATGYVKALYREWYETRGSMNGKALWWLRTTSNSYPAAYVVSPAESIGFAFIEPGCINGVRPSLRLKV